MASGARRMMSSILRILTSGILTGTLIRTGAAASTAAGVTIAAQTFAAPLLSAGVPAVSAAAMSHADATVSGSLRLGICEGMEKKNENFAEKVAKQMGAN